MDQNELAVGENEENHIIVHPNDEELAIQMRMKHNVQPERPVVAVRL